MTDQETENMMQCAARRLAQKLNMLFQDDHELHWLAGAVTSAEPCNFVPEPKTEIQTLVFELWLSQVERHLVIKKLEFEKRFAETFAVRANLLTRESGLRYRIGFLIHKKL